MRSSRRSKSYDPAVPITRGILEALDELLREQLARPDGCALADRPLHGQNHLPHRLELGTEPDEHLSSDALPLANEPEQDVAGADGAVTAVVRLTKGKLEHSRHAG